MQRHREEYTKSRGGREFTWIYRMGRIRVGREENRK